MKAATRNEQSSAQNYPVLKVGYKPNLGYIGQKRVTTSNYLFSTEHETVVSHRHAKGLLETFLRRSPEEHYIKSELLTEFIRKRGLTFSKKLENGESRIFTVPVTSSIVPLAKSTFNELETNAQALVMSLRWILQSIYGAEKPEDSEFVQSLPSGVREIFLRTVLTSPQYFTQLHHPSMRDYPFFEIVGLDLVLVDEYVRQNEKIYAETSEQELPFKLLELNAGSPSGASNNNSVLEGLLEVDPEFARIQERVMPNDHFDVLRATFDSIGRVWTRHDGGLSVILPPGGANGAAPEIHQLAAFSGMPYIDASMLYLDEENYLRLRTLSGENPRVTSIYSRVNADAALYDPKRGIFMRDADSGEPIYQDDALAAVSEDQKVPVLDKNGQPIPLDSIYAIPQAIDLIHARKLYLGGLNRVLDNKLILSTLTHYGPRFYEKRLALMGIQSQKFGLIPPETLPPEAESIDVIKANPDDWVVKAPDLSGGSGVHILLTLPEGKKKAVIQEAAENPTEWAYQKLVKIARIPVAVRENGRVRFSNLAADIRMWCFWGAGDAFPKPRLTHNGLVRYAPKEKGPLSSIVNTSKGGGYAPLLVIDDTASPDSCTVLELTATKTAPTQATSTPIFIGAQVYQISRMIQKALHDLNEDATTAASLLELGIQMKAQLNEVLSYLSPRNMEPLSAFIGLLEKKSSARKAKKTIEKHTAARAKLIEFLIEHEAEFSEHFFDQFRKLRCLKDDFTLDSRSAKLAHQDRARLAAMIESEHGSKLVLEAARLAKIVTRQHMNERPLSTPLRAELRGCLEAFAEMALDRLSRSEDRDLAHLFTLGNLERPDRMEQVCHPLLPQVAPGQSAPIATLWELQNKRSLLDSSFVSPEIREAHTAWHRVKAQVRRLGTKLTKEERKQLLERKRAEHFRRYPFLAEMQALIDRPHGRDPMDMWKILPALPYAKYNIEQYLKQKGLTPEQLFTDRLQGGRVAFLDREQLVAQGLNPFYAGECFAQKREEHGLFSNSDILTWMSQESSSFIQAYTLGHELVHFHQIEELMKKEILAMNRGSLDFAEFLNFYGNFLGSAVSSVEKLDQNALFRKTVFYGLADLVAMKKHTKLVKKLLKAYRSGDDAKFESALRKTGALLSWMVPTSAPLQVKAVREAIPCLENAKNIRFAKDLGLVISLDETRSALPAANPAEVKRHRPLIERASMSGGAELGVLHLIANHQFFGVRAELDIKSGFNAVYLSDSYNSAQQ